MFEELVNHQQRLHLAKSLWHKTEENGWLVFVSPGTPKGFRFVHDLRSLLLEEGDGVIVAPCPHLGACPLADRLEWCHFAVDYPNYSKAVFPGKKHRNILREKYSYIVFQKVKPGQAQETHALLQETHKSFKWARILKPILRKGGHRIVDICSLDGEFRRLVVSKSQGRSAGF